MTHARRIRRPPLTEAQILAWADAFHAKHGRRPIVKKDKGIPDSGGENWANIADALMIGLRGLPGGSSLSRLLAQHRDYGVVPKRPARPRQRTGRLRKPPLSEEQILEWADAFHARHGRWPDLRKDKIVPGSEGEKWSAINAALIKGNRGLPGGSSLPRLLAKHRGRRNIMALPRLTITDILAWADAHQQRTGEWPTIQSGPVLPQGTETWCGIDHALYSGLRGLPGRSSLAQLLEDERGVRHGKYLRPYSVAEILAWADEHYARTGEWPTKESGPVTSTPGETWRAVEVALNVGGRGLPGDSTLPRLLAEHRGIRNHMDLPPHTVEQILAWADEHHARTGRWPGQQSGSIVEAPGETWMAVEAALQLGHRGLPGGSSLARLFAQQRGARNIKDVPALTEEQILAWADEHHARTGLWPKSHSGPITPAPGETWLAVATALSRGARGLPEGSSLARLFTQHRGVRNHRDLPPLTEIQILAWAEKHRQRSGRWPTRNSGPIDEAPGETWGSVDAALHQGCRGLPGGSSLSRLLAKHRGARR
jgi:hypothetical protein